MLGNVLMTGLEHDPDGSVRVYVGARYTGVHTHIDDPKAIAEVERAWGDSMAHVCIPRPPTDALCKCATTKGPTDD